MFSGHTTVEGAERLGLVRKEDKLFGVTRVGCEISPSERPCSGGSLI